MLGQTHPELLRHYMDNVQLAFNSVLQLLMLQAWNPYFLTFNAPLWSLSALFFFYLLFPWAAPRLMNVRNPWLGICMLAYLLPPVWVISGSNSMACRITGLLQRLPLFRVPEFFGGILAYVVFKRAHQAGQMLLANARRAMVLFIVACFLTATVLFTHVPKY
ncbi:MAG: acyltransferase family protein [Sodalis sp. (in: enterobacteria)]